MNEIVIFMTAPNSYCNNCYHYIPRMLRNDLSFVETFEAGFRAAVIKKNDFTSLPHPSFHSPILEFKVPYSRTLRGLSLNNG